MIELGLLPVPHNQEDTNSLSMGCCPKQFKCNQRLRQFGEFRYPREEL